MNLKLRVACAALLATAAAPAWALQLGQIQVKSALNQPLVAAIPLHPKHLTELEGLTVGLAPAEDFARAGLQVTPTDQTLQFHVVTDNNGQKLILVTSTQPITDPYLDFLLQVNTREGKQVREFVVLLNPVIAAPAPTVQAAPVASAPVAAPPHAQPAQLPPSSAFAQPAVQPQPQAQSQPPASEKPAAPPPAPATPPPAPRPAPQPAPPPAPAVQPDNLPASVEVHRGDTLYGIAKDATRDSNVTINQLMVAIKAANPDAFFKDNINDLKAGAILRIPTRDVVDQTSVAEANAEVHRQYESWRAARPHPATEVQGTAAEAAANAAPKPGKSAPASDHLSLVPASGEGTGTSNRPGVAGGNGNETVTGLQQKLQNDRGALVSLNQSNADLESRVRSLKDISAKSDKLLSMKDATIAELQRKLANVQSGAGASSVAAAASAGQFVAKTPVATSAAPASAAAAKPAAKTSTVPPWYERPLTWMIAGVVVLALILIGLLRKRRGGEAPLAAHGPLTDPEDVAPQIVEPEDESVLQACVAEHPENLAAHLELCRFHYGQEDEARFVAAATAMREHVTDPHGPEWQEVVTMGEELAPHLPLFELPPVAHEDPYGMAALHQPADDDATVVRTPASHAIDAPMENEPAPGEPVTAAHMEPDVESVMQAWRAEPSGAPAVAAEAEPEQEFADDPVDTKLDLARAYLDMGDPVGARAMLEEVIEEGSQTQKDEAKRLLADVAG